MSDKRIVITGAGGFVGSRLCRKLAQRYAVTAVDRAPEVMNHLGGVANITPMVPADPREALEGAAVVVHLAARVHQMQETAADPLAEYRKINVELTRSWASAAAECGVGRFVFISSIKVNGEATPVNVPFTEQSTPAPQDPYGQTKWEAEQVLAGIRAQAKMEVAVVRPPLMYGPGVRANFLSLLGAVAKRRPLPLGSVANCRSLLCVDNMIAFLEILVDHPAAANETFLVRDNESLSTADLVRLIARGMDVSPRLWPVPVWMLYALATPLGKKGVIDRLVGSLVVDDSKARKLLGWSAPLPAADALAATARWFLAEGTAK